MRSALLIGFFLIYQLIFVSPAFAAISLEISENQFYEEEIIINIKASGLTSASCPNTVCYLQGMFKPESDNKYFGFTQNNQGGWYKYDGTPDPIVIKSDFMSFIPLEGSWSGQLKVKPDFSDADYQGPGNYLLSVRRYTGNSSGPTSEKSNNLSFNFSFLTITPTPTPTSTPSPTPTKTTTPSTTTTPVKTPSPTTPTPPSKVEGGREGVLDLSETPTASISIFLGENTDTDVLSASESASISGEVLSTSISVEESKTDKITIVAAAISVICFLLFMVRKLRIIHRAKRIWAKEGESG